MQLWIWARFPRRQRCQDARKPFCQVSLRHRGVRPLSYFPPPPVILSVGRTATAVEEPSLRIHFNLVILSERSESKDLRLTAAHDRYEAVIACLLSTFRPHRAA